MVSVSTASLMNVGLLGSIYVLHIYNSFMVQMVFAAGWGAADAIWISQTSGKYYIYPVIYIV